MNEPTPDLEASPDDQAHPPDRSPPVRRRAILLLVIFTSLAHLPLLFSDSVLWDSQPLTEALERGHFDLLYRVFRSSGAPQLYYLHYGIGQVPHVVQAYKLTAFGSIVGATVCVFWLCQTVPFLGLLEAFSIAAISAVYPFYSLWQEAIAAPYAVCYFLFCLAACCYSRYLSDPASGKRWLALSVPLFVASFAVQSLLVYFYALFLFFFLREGGGQRWGEMVRFARRNALALVLPVAFFLVVRWLFPTGGVYETYNRIQLSPVYLAKWVVVIPKRVILDTARELRFAATEPQFFLALAGYAVVALVPVFLARRLPSKNITGRQFAIALGFAILLFYLGVFPYAVVGKFPVVSTYASRHGLLAALPIAISLVVTLRFALRKEAVFLAGVGAALLCALVAETRNYILWQNRYVKYLAIVEQLKKQPDELEAIVVLQDDAPLGMPQQLGSYEVNWLMNQAFGNERHLGFDATQFDEEMYRRMDVPAKHEYYLSGDFEPGPQASRITVERNSSDSELAVYLGYLAAGANPAEFLDRLVRVRVSQEPVPWDVNAPVEEAPAEALPAVP